MLPQLVSSLWYTCFLHADIWMKNITNIALYEGIWGHKNFTFQRNAVSHQIMIFYIITTVTRRHSSHGTDNKSPCIYCPCLQDKDPGWPLVAQWHVAQAKRNKPQQSTHTMNKGWTLFLHTHSITCEYVQRDWLHNTFHKRHKSLCLLTSNSRKTNHCMCT